MSRPPKKKEIRVFGIGPWSFKGFPPEKRKGRKGAAKR
jgi:hypothetical protein